MENKNIILLDSTLPTQVRIPLASCRLCPNVIIYTTSEEVVRKPNCR